MTTTPLVWKAESLANTTTTGLQSVSQVISLDDGGYVVIWNDDSHTFSTATAVVGQRFDANGVKVGGEVKVSVSAAVDETIVGGGAITNLHNGNIAVAYTHIISGTDTDIHVGVDHASLGFVRNDFIDFAVNLTKNASITSFANGGYVVSYTLDNGGGNTDILARIVSPTGLVGAQILVRDNGALDADLSQLATLSNGNFVDVYQQTIGRDHDIDFDIRTQAGAVVANDFPVVGTTKEETDPDVVALAGGGFVVAWTDAAGDGAGNMGVRARIFNNAGNSVTGIFALNTTTAGSQNETSLVALADGGFMAIWEEDTVPGVDRGQRFDALGNKVGTEFVVKTNPVGSLPDSPDLALLQDGRVVATFGDFAVGFDFNITNTIFDPRTLHQNFDGINQGDFLWQHDSGQAAVWLLKGTTPISVAAVGGNPGADWHLLGDGDFNQDGRSDFLWQHDSGLPAIWTMNGTNITGIAALPNPGPTWHIAAAADFNGDGKSDILWQHDSGLPAIWTMDGTTITGIAALPNPGPTWHIAAAADFNGDGKADVLWQDDGGLPAIWTMNGTNITGVAALPNPGPTWDIVEATDFTGDGKADILWQDDGGLPAVWTMNGTNITGVAVLPNPGSDWHVI
jgi:hypothetical protein